MDLNDFGYGAGGGFLGTVLAYFGIKQRIDKLENSVVYKDVCKVCSAGLHRRIEDMHQDLSGKLDMVIESVKK